jgi:hypothetical protein
VLVFLQYQKKKKKKENSASLTRFYGLTKNFLQRFSPGFTGTSGSTNSCSRSCCYAFTGCHIPTKIFCRTVRRFQTRPSSSRTRGRRRLPASEIGLACSPAQQMISRVTSKTKLIKGLRASPALTPPSMVISNLTHRPTVKTSPCEISPASHPQKSHVLCRLLCYKSPLGAESHQYFSILVPQNRCKQGSRGICNLEPSLNDE